MINKKVAEFYKKINRWWQNNLNKENKCKN
jgi:hypothetical protein